MENKSLRIGGAGNAVRGLLGALLGGIVGHLAFLWLIRQGFYAVALPGACLGLGCGLLIQRRSFPLAAVCGALGLAVGLLSEWRGIPLATNDSLGYFLWHLDQLRGRTWLMLLLGAAFSGYLALGGKSKTLE